MSSISDLALPLLTAIAGYWAKSLFDARDLRRDILQEPFSNFEKTANEIRHTWREIQRGNWNANNFQAYFEQLNKSLKMLSSSYREICYACDKICEIELKEHLQKAYESLEKGVLDYNAFLKGRDEFRGDFSDVAREYRESHCKLLERSSKEFDKIYPELLLPVYKRYYRLISSTFLLYFYDARLSLVRKLSWSRH